jgi:hypothetical protein
MRKVNDDISFEDPFFFLNWEGEGWLSSLQKACRPSRVMCEFSAALEKPNKDPGSNKKVKGREGGLICIDM